MFIRESHKNILRRLAWDYSNENNNFEELFSESVIAYYNAIENFDPEKSKLSTFVWNCVRNHLFDYVKKESKISKKIQFIGFNEIDSDLYSKLYIPSNIDDLPLNEKTIKLIKIVLNNNNKLRKVKPKMARGLLFELLKKQNWSHSSIWSSFKELKQFVNESEMGSIILK